MKKIILFILTILGLIFIVSILSINCAASDIIPPNYGENPPMYDINGSNSPLLDNNFWLDNFNEKSFANPNVYISTPSNWGSNIGSLSSQHTKFLFNKHSISQVTTSYNDTNLYYTHDQLDYFDFTYLSAYQILTPNLISDTPIVIEVEVQNQLNFNQFVQGVYIPYNYAIRMSNYNAYAYVGLNYTNPIQAGYDMYVGIIVFNMPFQKFFGNNTDNYLTHGFYIKNINFGSYSLSSTASRRYSCLTHLFDIFVLNKGFNIPKKNNIIHAVVNNIGYVNNKFLHKTNNFEYFTMLDGNLNGEKIRVHSISSVNDFDIANGYGYYNLDVYCDTGNYELNYFALVSNDYFKNFDIGNVYLAIDYLLQGKYIEFSTSILDMPRDLLYFRCGSINDDYTFSNITSTIPYYSSFCIFATMPSSADGAGNSALDFNTEYGNQYYVEPTSWKDFGAHFSNALVWLAFECPVLNNLTGPLYLFLNSFSEVWVNLLFPLITALGVFGSAIICFFIYKFISMLITAKSD